MYSKGVDLVLATFMKWNRIEFYFNRITQIPSPWISHKYICHWHDLHAYSERMLSGDEKNTIRNSKDVINKWLPHLKQRQWAIRHLARFLNQSKSIKCILRSLIYTIWNSLENPYSCQLQIQCLDFAEKSTNWFILKRKGYILLLSFSHV